MANAARGMPLAPEVNLFHAHISCDQQFFATWNAQNRAIIADAARKLAAMYIAGRLPEPLDKFSFRKQAFHYKPAVTKRSWAFIGLFSGLRLQTLVTPQHLLLH
jgi:hypothetical protein